MLWAESCFWDTRGWGELINHLVLLLTLQGVQSSLLYLLSACEIASLPETADKSFVAKVRHWISSEEELSKVLFRCLLLFHLLLDFYFHHGNEWQMKSLYWVSSSKLQDPPFWLDSVSTLVWLDISCSPLCILRIFNLSAVPTSPVDFIGTVYAKDSTWHPSLTTVVEQILHFASFQYEIGVLCSESPVTLSSPLFVCTEIGS